MDSITKATLLTVINGTFDEYDLSEREVSLGRDRSNVDICIRSAIVSRVHGKFISDDGEWYYQDLNSGNGTFVNGEHLFHNDTKKKLNDGEVIRIDTLTATGVRQKDGVLLYFFLGDFRKKFSVYNITDEVAEGYPITIGRDQTNILCFDTVTVSRYHATITYYNGQFILKDLKTTNGTFVNGKRIVKDIQLLAGDVLLMGNIRLIFTGLALIYNRPDSGSYLSIRGLYREVPDMDNRGRRKTILHDVNTDIGEAELVAVLGTSGAGKTTFMNCVIGYESPSGGQVMINGASISGTDKKLRKTIGYVPQQDLLRDDLSVESTLDYIAALRLPKDVSIYERTSMIDRILTQLDLEPGLKKSKIRKLSGGQKKRISIASELISDPPLLFLDEPTSGLDPETETNLVSMLRKLAHENGKTLIVVTHTIRNIMQFDRVLFFGPGGHLCYSGSPKKAMEEFDVQDFVDIYTKVRENVEYYYSRCSEKSMGRA